MGEGQTGPNPHTFDQRRCIVDTCGVSKPEEKDKERGE
jgi:hypothetical protein